MFIIDLSFLKTKGEPQEVTFGPRGQEVARGAVNKLTGHIAHGEEVMCQDLQRLHNCRNLPPTKEGSSSGL